MMGYMAFREYCISLPLSSPPPSHHHVCNYAILFTYARLAVIIAPARSSFCIRAAIFAHSLGHNRPHVRSRNGRKKIQISSRTS